MTVAIVAGERGWNNSWNVCDQPSREVKVSIMLYFRSFRNTASDFHLLTLCLQLCNETPLPGNPRKERSIGEMGVLRISLQCSAFVMLFHFTACTKPTTYFSSIWKDETYQAQTEKILVINAFGDPGYRRQFEDGFVTALKDRRIDAVVSYRVMPDIVTQVLVDKDALAVQAKAVGADTVFINRPLGTEQRDVWVSNTDGTDKYKLYINTQTDVYDMKTNRLVFSVSAETRIKKNKLYADQIQSYIKDLINMMSQAGLLSKL
jgi:hypothetical protein